MTRVQENPWIVDEPIDIRNMQDREHRSGAGRINIYQISWIRALIENRWLQFLLRAVALIGFLFTILAGLLGSRVGSHNFAIIMVWIGWWTTLKLGFIPFGGRSWCSICPIPLPAEWVLQGGILQKGRRSSRSGKRWPKWLKGTWMQSGGFLLIGIFSAITLTDPRVTGWVLLAIFVLAFGLGLVFEKRAFCQYACPIGGFSGMYAKVTPVEIRVLDKKICAKHAEKTCYQACPWGLYPVAFKDSSACGLCMECLRACPKDNLALNIRPYGADLGIPHHSERLDETFLALVMLGSALAFSAVFLGPWGWLKSAAFEVGSRHWLGYAAGFLGLNILLLPGVFSLCVWLWKKLNPNNQSMKQLIANQAQGLLPLGLMSWIAFTVSFALPKLNLIGNVLNDPFGWGWHLLSSATLVKAIDVSSFSTILQVILVAAGVIWSTQVTQRLSREDDKNSVKTNYPVLLFYLAYSILLLWLLVG